MAQGDGGGGEQGGRVGAPPLSLSPFPPPFLSSSHPPSLPSFLPLSLPFLLSLSLPPPPLSCWARAAAAGPRRQTPQGPPAPPAPAQSHPTPPHPPDRPVPPSSPHSLAGPVPLPAVAAAWLPPPPALWHPRPPRGAAGGPCGMLRRTWRSRRSRQAVNRSRPATSHEARAGIARAGTGDSDTTRSPARGRREP